MDMELNHLTEEERDRILSVLRRDEELRSKDLDRIRNLKSEVKRIRLKGVIKAGHDPDKTCARCREKFGWLFNKGALCPQCQHRVCDKCKSPLDQDPSKWLCVLCHKQMELDAMSGQWFLMKFRKSKRSRKTNKVITGQEMVKASIRRRPLSTDDEEGDEGGGGGGGGTPADEVRKSLSNNNSSPKSSRSAGSASVESSDTQSTASTSPGRRAPQRPPSDSVHDMGFPKESDKQKLLDLIRSKAAPVMGTKEQLTADKPPTVEVRKVSMSRYRSDSESSSSSGPSSPQLSARTDSEFRYSDSVRSSMRSSGAFSAVSSEGRITIVTESNVSDIDTTSFASIQSLNDSREESCGTASPAGLYDRDADLFKSSDSVIENVAHRPSPQHTAKLTGLRKDTTDGSLSISHNEVTVRKVISSKLADSMSSDSDAEDTTTEQVSKVKFRRIPAGKGTGRSRSPSPEPRSRLRQTSEVPANALPSSETESVGAPGAVAVVGGGAVVGRDGQAGGDTNTAPPGPSSRHRALLAHSQSLHQPPPGVSGTTLEHQLLEESTRPKSGEAEGNHDSKVEVSNQPPLLQTQPPPPPSSPRKANIRDKVGALLARYGRAESVQDDNHISNGDGALLSKSQDSEDEEDSSTTSSYEIIDATAEDSSFDELEWDSDHLTTGHLGQARSKADWDELRAAVAANMAAQESSSPPKDSGHIEDGMQDADQVSPPFTSNRARYNWARGQSSLSQDDWSDALSVITELTEPDEDFYQFDKDIYARSPPMTRDNSKAAGNDAQDNDKDHGYFTLPGRGAVSRTESMRSAAESEISHSSITPSSDVDTDLSQISEVSGTESTLELAPGETKRHSISSEKQESLDDMVVKAEVVGGLTEMDIDDMYRVNLEYLDEEDLQGLTLPSRGSLKAPKSDPLPRKFYAPRELRLSDRRRKADRPTGVHSLTAIYEKEKSSSTKRGSWPPKSREHLATTQSDSLLKSTNEESESSVSPAMQRRRAQLKSVEAVTRESDPLKYTESSTSESDISVNISPEIEKKSMSKATSDSALLSLKVETDKSYSPQLLRKRAELKHVANRKSDPISYSKTSGSEVDSSIGNRQRLGKTTSDSSKSDMSVSPDLQRKRASLRNVDVAAKRRSDPLEYSKKSRGKDEKPVDDTNLASISDLTKMFDHPPPYLRPSVRKETELEKLQEDFLERDDSLSEDKTYNQYQKKVEFGNVTEIPVVTKEELKKDLKTEKVEVQKKGKAEKKEKSKKEKTKKDKDEKSTKVKDSSKGKSKYSKEQAKEVDQKTKEVPVVKINATVKTASSRSKVFQESKDEFNIAKQEQIPEFTPYEESSKLTKRAPSPTAKAVKEKVGSTRSVQLREIICEELEKEVMENVADIGSFDDRFGTVETTPKAKDTNLASSPVKHLSPVQGATPKGSVEMRKSPVSDRSPASSWYSSPPSEVEQEVEQQLDAWKKKRESKRKRESLEKSMAAHALSYYDQLQVENEPLRTSTPPKENQPQKAVFNSERSPVPNPEGVVFIEKGMGEPMEEREVGRRGHGVQEREGTESDDQQSASEKADTSYELEEAFLSPRVATPATDDDHMTTALYSRPRRPQRPLPSADDDEELDSEDEEHLQGDTESTLTPDTDRPTPPAPAEHSMTSYQHRTSGYTGSASDDDAQEDHAHHHEEEEEEEDLVSLTDEEVSDLSEQDSRSYSTAGTGSIDGKHANGHAPQQQGDTSSVTESDAGSVTSSGRERVSHREHKTSVTSVPSINVTHHDNESNTGRDTPDQAEAPQSERAPSPTPPSTIAPPPEAPGSTTEEECEDIDELVASHTSPTHSVHSQKGGNMLSPFSGSKESIVSFYSDAGEGNYGNIPISGEIQFALEYNYKTGSLEVKIKQCRDLAPVDTKKKRSDPYAKVYLLPDKTKSGKRKTRVKKHTLNPVFDEVLKFSITKSELETRTLWITVWHSDMFGRNDFLGEVTVPLDYYRFDEPTAQWYKLQERPTAPEDENASPLSLLTYKGDLILSLKYVTSENAAGGKARGGGNSSARKERRAAARGELHVLLKEARNLTAVRANGFSDPFCKGYLLPDKGRGTKQKTPVAKRDCNPQWNHTFVFDDVSLDELRDRSLELTVWDHDRFTSNDFLGGLRLNIGTGKVGGKEVDWMDSRGEEISMWQAMLDRPNCWIDGSLMLRTTMGRRK